MPTAAIKKFIPRVFSYGEDLHQSGEFKTTWYDPDGTIFAERDYDMEFATGVWWMRDPDIFCWRIMNKTQGRFSSAKWCVRIKKVGDRYQRFWLDHKVVEKSWDLTVRGTVAATNNPLDMLLKLFSG